MSVGLESFLEANIKNAATSNADTATKNMAMLVLLLWFFFEVFTMYLFFVNTSVLHKQDTK